jgi:hypothetical protein
MENGYDADAGAQMSGIGGDRDQRLGRGLEQEIIDRRLVLIGDVRDSGWQREHDVIVGHGQQFGLALSQPRPGRRALTLRTVSVTAGNGRRPLPALWAKFVMGSQQASISDSGPVRGFLAPHYDLFLSMAISLSGGRKEPFLRCGGTMASMASSLSVGSPRI